MTKRTKAICARFYKLESGRQPVREWLLNCSRQDRSLIGRDSMKIEFGWPVGPPLCLQLSGYAGLHEARCRLTGRRIARIFFTVYGGDMVLLHGFIKKTQATPLKEIGLAARRMREVQDR